MSNDLLSFGSTESNLNSGSVAPFIQATGEGCAILTTTRMPAIGTALAAENAALLKLSTLRSEDAFDLLSRLAKPATVAYPEECRALLQAIGYLPLAIHVAGRLLADDYALGVPKIVWEIFQRAHEKVLAGVVPPTQYPSDLNIAKRINHLERTPIALHDLLADDRR